MHILSSISDCGALTDPADGTVEYNPIGDTTYQSVATFTCDTGFTLSLPITRTCQDDMTWSNISPACNINGMYYRTFWLL